MNDGWPRVGSECFCHHYFLNGDIRLNAYYGGYAVGSLAMCTDYVEASPVMPVKVLLQVLHMYSSNFTPNNGKIQQTIIINKFYEKYF